MNASTLLGMTLGLALFVMVAVFAIDDVSVFLNLPGLAIVLGGTLAATLISYPLREVLRVFRVFLVILRSDNEHLYAREHLREISRVARLWYQGDIAQVETQKDRIKNPFLRAGVEAVIDGVPMEDVQALLQWRIGRAQAKELGEAQVFRSMAMYAPAFGMIGTLLGLVNMLFAMQGHGLETIGYHMAIAMITTLYGITLANLVFKPIAIKFERRAEKRIALMNIALEGIMLISERRSPSYTDAIMKSFLQPYEEELYKRPGA